MKILYIGFNRSYTNPTSELLLGIFGNIAKFDLYGPGFSKPTDIEMGINKWFEKNDDYDFIMVDSYVLECENIIKRKKPFIGDCIKFEPAIFLKFSLEYQSFFLSYKGDKLFLCNWDIYNVSAQNIEKLVKSNCYVLEGGLSTTASKLEIEDKYGSRFDLGNDNWYNYVKTYSSKIISTPHFVSLAEFNFTPLFSRKHLFNVVGAPYPERKMVISLLSFNQKIKYLQRKILNKIFFSTRKTLSAFDLNKLRESYNWEISNSKFCFCSGGQWLYPVRKYFEIPCKGSVSIGWECIGFENLGFENGKNFVTATTSEQIFKTIKDFENNEFQNIAIRGRDLIFSCHSDFARTNQLKESLELILSKNFSGSYWKNGKYLHF